MVSHPFISQIKIRNFRNFKRLNLSLEPSTVIVGENRAGKSNLIDALRLVLDPSLPDSLRHLRSEDFWEGLDRPFEGNIIEVKVFIKGFHHSKEAECVLCDCVIDEGGETALLTYQFRPRQGIEPKEAVEEDYEFVLFGGLDEKNRVGTEVRKWISLLVLPALRDAEGTIQSWRRSPLRPLIERVRKQIPSERFEEVRNALDDATADLFAEPAVKTLSDNINSRIRELVGPIHAIETQFDLASSEPEQLLRSIRLFLKETQTRPLADVSLGSANILFLALLLQEIEAKEEAKDLVSTILAIEEPEAHLHPHVQRRLFRHFLSRENAVLLTTHSPNIASVAPLRSIVLLRITGQGSKGFTIRGSKLDEQGI